MEKDYLTLKRASVSRPSGQWNDDDYDVLADATVVGRIMKVHAAPEARRGYGRSPLDIMKIARRRTATSRCARPRWRRLRRAGGGSSSKIGKSAFGGKPENICLFEIYRF